MTGEFIILDFFGSCPMIVTDEEGNVMYFDTKISAELYAKENLQPDYYKVIESL